MKIYLACWEDMMVLFHLLAACCFDLHAAHTRDVRHNCFRMRNLSQATFILKQRFPFQSLFLNYPILMMLAVFFLSFFLFFFGRGGQFLFICWELEREFIRNGNRRPRSLRAVNYAVFNEIKLMEAIKRNAKPYLWQINGAGLIIWAVSKWSSPSFFSDREVSLKSHNIIQLGDNYPRSCTAHACKYCMDACSVILKPRPPQPLGCDIGWGENLPPLMSSSPPHWTRALCLRCVWFGSPFTVQYVPFSHGWDYWRRPPFVLIHLVAIQEPAPIP